MAKRFNINIYYLNKHTKNTSQQNCVRRSRHSHLLSHTSRCCGIFQEVLRKYNSDATRCWEMLVALFARTRCHTSASCQRTNRCVYDGECVPTSKFTCRCNHNSVPTHSHEVCLRNRNYLSGLWVENVGRNIWHTEGYLFAPKHSNWLTN